jgi:hypothetical protein
MSTSRRFVAGLIRLTLVVLALALVGRYFKNKFFSSHGTVSVQREAPPANEALGPGDLRIYSSDSAVDLVLSGNNILAGLSPKTVEKVKREMEKSTDRDTSGFAGSISQIVKSSVAGAIGTHAVYALSDIREIRYEDGHIVFDAKDGKQHDLFGSTKVNGNKVSSSFRPDDAQRFVEAVRARMEKPVEKSVEKPAER